MESVIAGLGFLLIGYTMFEDRFLFGRLTSYLALLGGVLFIAALPAAASPAAFGVLSIVSSVVLAAFEALVGRRLYRLSRYNVERTLSVCRVEAELRPRMKSTVNRNILSHPSFDLV